MSITSPWYYHEMVLLSCLYERENNTESVPVEDVFSQYLAKNSVEYLREKLRSLSGNGLIVITCEDSKTNLPGVVKLTQKGLEVAENYKETEHQQKPPTN